MRNAALWLVVCTTCCSAWADHGLSQAPALTSTTIVDPLWNDLVAPQEGEPMDWFQGSGLSEPAPQLVSRRTSTEPWCAEVLPDGLVWRSYLAAPHEPRISAKLFHTSEDGNYWDATLGGRVGLLRYGTAGALDPEGLQWDLEGAVMTRLDMRESQDVESMDFRFGTQVTYGEGPWAAKLGYFHISSHLGDEYLLRLGLTDRTNYVTESLVFGGSYTFSDVTRVYGELANAFVTSGGAERYQFQSGAEYVPAPKAGKLGSPFAAINLNFREAVEYDVTTTLQAGWLFRGPRSGRRMRFGLEYGNGPTNQYSFFQRRESYIGFGTWFDF